MNSDTIVIDIINKDEFCSSIIKEHCVLGDGSMGMTAPIFAKRDLKTSAVIGMQHTDLRLQEFSEVCSPFFLNNSVAGYLDIFFNCRFDHTFAIALVSCLCSQISDSIGTCKHSLLQNRVDSTNNQIPLTVRETEVARLWAKNKDIEEISAQLSITNYTVRTHIKHIYAKLGLKNKGDFIISCIGLDEF